MKIEYKLIKPEEMNTYSSKNGFLLHNIKKIKKQGAIYLIYNNKNELLYVGETSNFQSRLASYKYTQCSCFGNYKEHGDEIIFKYFYIKNTTKRFRKGLESLYINKYKPKLMCQNYIGGGN